MSKFKYTFSGNQLTEEVEDHHYMARLLDDEMIFEGNTKVHRETVKKTVTVYDLEPNKKTVAKFTVDGEEQPNQVGTVIATYDLGPNRRLEVTTLKAPLVYDYPQGQLYLERQEMKCLFEDITQQDQEKSGTEDAGSKQKKSSNSPS